ncbi:hypothetical protein, variant [Saprolegnia diclina VS20]|uniref:Phorbol-ester/DAG-type domain-containing protein n=1 Tax=Saprolegnia diclina (strain VS20) TaxID=1156394 RepID=T0RZ46_SAPDV|nr:hypothetical protein, variant [Saprolegnia diclina VS20]EQC37923.1 hypothetical protein, variant [Saprolegnia diclina VS20]|eukprot:XP_008608856.1 hypothetical protein, variant [Saprolegnia diclina VS20]
MVGPWLCHPGHYHSFQSSEAPHALKERPSYLTSLGLSRTTPKSPSVHCLICHRVLDANLCTCLACGLAVHRACLSKTQRTSSMKREDRVIPVCTSYLARTMAPSTPEAHPTPASPQLQLLEELSLDPLHMVSPRTPQAAAASSNVALRYIRRYAPYVAGGVLVGGAAVMGMPMMALTGLGVGLSASTAQGSLAWSSRASSERTKAAMDVDWARRICWELKQKTEIGDSSYKQDAALLRRYHNATDAPPTTNDVYIMLFGLCASTDELLGRVNSALCDAFRSRRKLHPCLKQTLEDAQVYVGHVLAVTMNTYPALSTTDESIMDATEAVEKIVYRCAHFTFTPLCTSRVVISTRPSLLPFATNTPRTTPRCAPVCARCGLCGQTCRPRGTSRRDPQSNALRRRSRSTPCPRCKSSSTRSGSCTRSAAAFARFATWPKLGLPARRMPIYSCPWSWTSSCTRRRRHSSRTSRSCRR